MAARVQPGLGADRPGEESDGGDRVLHQLSGDEAQQLVAAAIERLMAPAGTPQRPGHVDLGAAGALGEPGEPGTGVDGELPTARVVEPGDEPVVVPDDVAEAVRLILGVEHR